MGSRGAANASTRTDADFPRIATPVVIVGALCWTFSVVFFVVQAIAQASSARPFSLASNLISDLGNTACGPAVCSPLHDLMNGTFVAVGLLHWTGAAGTWRAWGAVVRSRAGLTMLSLAGWGLIYAGVFPENVAPDNHRIGALIGLVSLNLSMLLLGSALLGAARVTGVLALFAGVLGLVSLAMFLEQAGPLPIGVSERLADYPSAAMVVVIGALILVRGMNARSGLNRL